MAAHTAEKGTCFEQHTHFLASGLGSNVLAPHFELHAITLRVWALGRLYTIAFSWHWMPFLATASPSLRCCSRNPLTSLPFSWNAFGKETPACSGCALVSSCRELQLQVLLQQILSSTLHMAQDGILVQPRGQGLATGSDAERQQTCAL